MEIELNVGDTSQLPEALVFYVGYGYAIGWYSWTVVS